MSPVNANSIARWCGMRRGKRNRPPPMATTPLRTSGRPSLALDAATMRSQLRHNSSPPPTAYPSTAAINGLVGGLLNMPKPPRSGLAGPPHPAPAPDGISFHGRDQRLGGRLAEHAETATLRRGRTLAARHRLQVGASAEGAARASDDADEQAVVRIQHVHDGLHLTRGGQIERVPRLRAVARDDQDAAFALRREALRFAHGSLTSRTRSRH